MIELMIVIAILCILGLFTIGPMLRWRANSFVETAANHVMSDLERAKISSIRMGRNVSIAFNTDGSYEGFIDNNRNMVRDAGDTLLFQRIPEVGRVSAVYTTVGGGAALNPTGVTFNSRGFISNLNQPNSLQIVYTGVNRNSNLTRTVMVSRTGNVSSTATRD